MAYADVLTALSDPTRRAIVDLLRDTPKPVSQIAGNFAVSRPAISQHLRVLSDAGLVVGEPLGNRRFYRLEPRGFAGLRLYLDGLWDDALSAFSEAAHAEARTNDQGANS